MEDLPPWLEDLVSEALGSDEWEELSEHMMQEVQDRLERRGLKFFSDLPEADKGIFIDELEQDVQMDEAYEVFFRRLGGTLDKKLLAVATKGEEPENERSAISVEERVASSIAKEDARFNELIFIIGEAAGALLKRHPHRIRDVKTAGNRGLLGELRRQVWQLQLRNSEQLAAYNQLAEGHRLNVISKMDIDIAKSCRVLMDTEFPSKNMSLFLLAVKSLVSYIHARHGGLVDGPIRYIAIALVWGINEGNSQPIEGANLVEAFTALLDDAGYESYFSLSDGSVAAGSEWREFSDEVLSCLGDADADYTESLLRVTSNMGRDLEGQMAKTTESFKAVKDFTARSGRKVLGLTDGPWDTSGHPGMSSSDMISLLVRPLVQRLFVGMLDSLESTCAIWDTLILLGWHLLPHVCASYLLAMKPYLIQVIGPDSPAEVLGWGLNATRSCLLQREIEVCMEKHFMRGLRRSLRLKDVRDECLDFYLPVGDGKPTVLTTTSKWERGEQGRVEEERLRKEELEALATKATKNDAAAQTDSSVSDLSEVLELLSPRLHRKQAMNLLRPPTPGPAPTAKALEELEEALPMNESPNSKSSQSKTLQGGNTVELWYANRIYSVKVPFFEPFAYKLSSVADLCINSPDNEDLLAAVVRHERRVPCTVARIQGTSLRHPSGTTLDVSLFDVLSKAFPTVEDDYTKPMLRIDLQDPEPGQPTEIYIHPLQPGVSLGSEVIEEASIALDLNLRHEQLMSYARLLEEYSKKPPRPRPQRVESGSGVGGEGLEKQENGGVGGGGGGGGIGGKIGIDLRIDTTLDHMLREVRRLDAKFIIDHRDADAMSLQGRQAVQKELSQVLRLPEDCIQATGLHQFGHHIMVEANIESNTNSFQPRTCMQAYDDLVGLINNPYSSLHSNPVIGRSVRVILRGRPHYHFERVPARPLTPPGPAAASGIHPSAMPNKEKAALIESVNKAKEAAYDPGQEDDEGGGRAGRDGGSKAAGGGGNAGVGGVKSSAGVGSLKSGSLLGGIKQSAGVGSVWPRAGVNTLEPILSEGIIDENADAEMDVAGEGGVGGGVVLPSSSTPAAARRDSTGGAIARLRMATKVMDASKAFADSTKFYFTLHKEKVGPYDLAAMKAEYKNGNLRPGTYVWYKALGRTWLKLQEDKGLCDALGVAYVPKEQGGGTSVSTTAALPQDSSISPTPPPPRTVAATPPPGEVSSPVPPSATPPPGTRPLVL